MKNLILYFLVSLSLSSCLNFVSPERSPLEFQEIEDVLPIDDDMNTDDDGDDSDDDMGTGPIGERVTFDELKSKVLEQSSCTTCHSWAGSEKTFLDSHRIKPGDADASLLFILVRTGAMPKAPFPAITSQQLELVERYINGLKQQPTL